MSPFERRLWDAAVRLLAGTLLPLNSRTLPCHDRGPSTLFGAGFIPPNGSVQEAEGKPALPAELQSGDGIALDFYSVPTRVHS